jgi:Fic family protein
VSIQAQDSVLRLNRLQGLRTKYQGITAKERNPKRMEQVLDFLFMRPVLSVRQLEKGLGITFPAAQRYIEKLVDAGVLHEMTGHARNRIFRADDIIRLLEGVGD